MGIDQSPDQSPEASQAPQLPAEDASRRRGAVSGVRQCEACGEHKCPTCHGCSECDGCGSLYCSPCMADHLEETPVCHRAAYEVAHADDDRAPEWDNDEGRWAL